MAVARSRSTTRANAPSAVMYAYPWAVHDMGVERALDEMRSCGADALQLALSYHVGTYLLPRGPDLRVLHGDLGSLHFDPRAVPDVEWPFAPNVSALVTGVGYSVDVLEAAYRRGMQTIVWLVYLFNHAIARARPELAVHNLYGNPSGAHLCPVNPDVRRYVMSLTQAVLGLGHAAGLHAESLSFLPFDHGFLNRKSAVVPSGRPRLALSLCFCGACREAARARGLRVEELRRELRSRVDAYLNDLPDDGDGTLGLSGEMDRELDALVALRAEAVVALQSQVLGLATAAGVRFTSNLVEGDDGGVNGGSGDLIRPRVAASRVRVLPAHDARAIRAAVLLARRRTRRGIPIYAFFQVERYDSELDFARAVERAVGAGLRHFAFYEFGVLTRRQLDWLRHAREHWVGPDR